MRTNQKSLAVIVILLVGLVLAYNAMDSALNKSKKKLTSPIATAQNAIHIPGSTIKINQSFSTIDPASQWVVVSKQFPLANPAYRPADLHKVSVASRSDKPDDELSLRQKVEPSLTAMFAAANKQGYAIMMASGFRSYQQQQTYFDSYTAAYGREKAETFSAHPGQSEHQTGLALDIAYTDMNNCYLEICFGQTPAGIWLAAHAHDYGFILRYPANKTAVTQYQYEPWHFRYVGKPLAKALYESGFTLDEVKPYLEKH